MTTPIVSNTSLFLFATCVGATFEGIVGVFLLPRFLIGFLKKEDPMDFHYREIIYGSVNAFIAMEKVHHENEGDSLTSLKELCRSLNQSASEMLPKIDIYLDLTTLETDSEKVNWAWLMNAFFFKFSQNPLALEGLPINLDERYEEADRRLKRITKEFGSLVIQNSDTLDYL